MRFAIWFLLSIFSLNAIADEQRTHRVLENPVQDGDLILRVNDGGVKTDALKVVGSTASTILGPSSGSFAGNRIKGVNDGTSVVAGDVGEIISCESTTDGNGSTNLTTGTNYNVATISLTPGSWIIFGVQRSAYFENHANDMNEGIYSTTICMDNNATGCDGAQFQATVPPWGNGTNSYAQDIPIFEVYNVSSNTTVYINAITSAYGTTSNSWIRFGVCGSRALRIR